MAAESWNSAVNGDWSTASDWSADIVPGSTTDVTITVAGAYDITVASAPESAHSITLDDAGGTLSVQNALAIGTTLAVESGTLDLSSGGIVQGGTIINSGGSVVFDGGTLDGVTYEGTLDLSDTSGSYEPWLYITDGITLTGTNGTGPGTINLTGYYSRLYVENATTLDNATINFGNSSYYDYLYDDDPTDSGAALTLGPHLDLVVAGNAYLGTSYTNDSIVNEGSISVVSGGALDLSGVASFSNAGSISISDTQLTIPNGISFSNTGSISVTDSGVLDLAGTVTMPGLAGVSTSDGGVVEVSGLLVNTGGTLDAGPGSALGTIDLYYGTIQGGTVHDTGGGIVFQSGELDGVTYEGTLDLSDTSGNYQPSLYITDGITLTGTNGTGPGTINLTGYYSRLYVENATTLDNATINFGNSSYYDYLYDDDPTDSGAALTLGPHLDLVVAGNAYLGTSYANDSIVNEGSISVVSGGALSFSDVTSFSNAGSISISDTQLTIPDTTSFSNTGSISVTDSGVLDLAGTVTMPGLAGVSTSDGGVVEVSGLLVNTGGTLDAGPGSALGTIDLYYGTIQGGTVHDTGGGIVFQSGELDGVTYEGTLDLSDTSGNYQPSLYITDGITLTGTNGTGPATINLTGYYSQLYVENATTLDNATINFGNSSYYDYLYDDDPTDSGAALTLGPHLDLVVAGNADLETSYTNDSIVNEGSISVVSGGALDLSGVASFSNAGSISIVSGGALNLSDVASFGNAGSISISDTQLTIANTATFSDTGSISVTDSGVLDLAGTVTTVGLAGVSTSDGGVVEVSGLLVNTGGTLDVGPGSALGTIDLYYGTIQGGTVHDTGGGIVFQSGELDGVTYEGTLDLSDTSGNYQPSLYITDGITLTGTNGTGPATINLTGYSSQLYVENTTTLDNATINFGNSSYYDYLYDYDPTASGAALTLGPNLDLVVAGNADLENYFGYADENVINEGTISVVSGGALTISQLSFSNTGSISVVSGGALNLSDVNSFSNAGSISISDTQLTIANTATFSDTGSISVTDSGVLDLAGTVTTAGLTGVSTSDGGVVEVSGLLVNTGGTLDVGPGSALGTIDLDGGTIEGGTIHDTGGGFVFQSGELDGVTYEGTLDLSSTSYLPSLTITGGITLTGTNGTGPGTINLTGYLSQLYVENTTTLDNATINFGNSSYYDGLYDYDPTASGAALTLGPNLDLVVAGNADLENYFGYADENVINEGTISVVSGGALTISQLSFSNIGSISVVSGGALNLSDVTSFSNAGSISISDTQLTIANTATFSDTGSISVTDSGVLDLAGTVTTAGLAGVSTSDGGVVEVSGLLINTGGTLDVGPGSALGTIDLDGGTIQGGTIHDTGGGFVFQSGELDGVTYEGTLDLSDTGESYEPSLTITSGITLTDTNGTGPGTINLTGFFSRLYVENTTTLDNATINVGNSIYTDYLYDYDPTDSGAALKLGPHLDLVVAGDAYLANYFGYANDRLANEGTISVVSGGALTISQLSFSNTGSISIVSGGALNLSDVTSFSNAGSISISGAQLTIPNGTTFGNSGSISVTDSGVLDLAGTVTTAGLAGIGTSDGGVVEVSGLLINTGGTLDVGPGSALGTIDLYGGTIDGGTIHDTGTGFVFQSGELDGVTYEGTLDLSDTSGSYVASLYIAGGITLTGTNGTGPGTINLTGLSSQLYVANTTTLDNATVNFGNSIYTDYLYDYDPTDSGAALTLGPHLDLVVAGNADLANDFGYANDSVTNEGSISIVSGGVLTISQLSFSNTGSISIVGGGALNLSDVTSFSNTGSISISDTQLTIANTTTFSNAGMLTVSDTTLTDAGSLLNNGTILLDPSTVTLAALTGTGEVVIDAGSTLDLQGTVASGQTIAFADHSGWLDLAPPQFAGEILGFVTGDTIDLTGVTDATSAGIIDGTTLQIERSANPAIDLRLDPNQNYAGVLFSLGTDGTPNEYDIVTTDLACFAAGTRLDTPDGPVAVEALRPGDRVLTAGGPPRAVRWIGWRRLDLRRHPDPAVARPVRILAGALAPGEPRRDVRLSPDHALLIGGRLIPVRLLINGATIRQENACRSVTYFHVELDRHDILLAEGLAAESYLDTGNRGMFENAGLPLTLHPDFGAGNDQARRVAESCAPFVADAGRVEPVWQALARRAGALGHVLPVAATIGDPALRVACGDRLLKPAAVSDGRHAFVLPRGAGPVRLVSRATPPNVLRPWLDDRRLLGVMVRRLTLRNGRDADAIPLDHPHLHDGWWGLERDGCRQARWTNGNAELPLLTGGPAILEVGFGAMLGYVVAEPDLVPEPMVRAALQA